jgi:hypothetical protein
MISRERVCSMMSINQIVNRNSAAVTDGRGLGCKALGWPGLRGHDGHTEFLCSSNTHGITDMVSILMMRVVYDGRHRHGLSSLMYTQRVSMNASTGV